VQTNWRIGSIFGIPLFLDPLWFVILGLATLNFGLSYQAMGGVVAWSAGVVMALLLFGSVLLHELGHSLVARSQGIKVNSITLFLSMKKKASSGARPAPASKKSSPHLAPKDGCP